MLDEPTAALSHAEVERLFEWLRNLRSNGVGVIYVSHRLQEVVDLTDRISIFRDGRLVCTQPTRGTSTNDMVEIMSGNGLSRPGAAKSDSPVAQEQGQLALQVRNISCG